MMVCDKADAQPRLFDDVDELRLVFKVHCLDFCTVRKL